MTLEVSCQFCLAKQRRIVELEAENERLREALIDVLSGCDAIREEIRRMVAKEVFVEDFAFWTICWFENGTPNLARARAALLPEAGGEGGE